MEIEHRARSEQRYTVTRVTARTRSAGLALASEKGASQISIRKPKLGKIGSPSRELRSVQSRLYTQISGYRLL
jgi:hypothetical protein